MTKDDRTQTPPRRVKKSETLEVRIPYETKQAFLNACREEGTTASEVVRDQVQSYLDARERSSQQEKRTNVMHLPQSVRRYGPRVAAGGFAAMGLTALAVLPSAADPDFKAQFSRLDANGDGALSVDEFLGGDNAATDKSEKNVVIETRSVMRTETDAPPSVRQELKQDAFTFWLPEEFANLKGDGAVDQKHEYKFVTRHEVRTTDDGQAVSKPSRITFSIDDMRKDEFASIDTNKDGKVSMDEYRARQTAMLTRGFEVLDTDGDKSLSEAEYAKIVAPVKIQMQGGPDTPEPPQIDIPAMKQPSPEAVKAAFARIDANKDGKISLQEYLPKT